LNLWFQIMLMITLHLLQFTKIYMNIPCHLNCLSGKSKL
jgi:hypothetical protein